MHLAQVPASFPPTCTVTGSGPPSTVQGPLQVTGHAVTPSAHQMVTPNRPPIPASLIQRINNGEYIDMEEMLPDNFPIGELSSGKEKGKQKPYPVPSILAWAECFVSYIGVLAMHQPARTPDLLAYMGVILYAARRYEGEEWRMYDANFRKQAAAVGVSKWAEVNPSLWTMAFSNAVASDYCSHCLSIDHKSGDCKKAGDKAEKDKKAPNQPHVPICRDWNKGRCGSATCDYRHVCMECHGEHPETLCCRQRSKPYYKTDRPTRSFQAYRAPFRGARGGGRR